jgi:hypothetical protein
VRDALERPLGFPPLRQAVVPGDRVAIPFDPDVPARPARPARALRDAAGGGGRPETIRVIATGPGAEVSAALLPRASPGPSTTRDDRAGIAYLATSAGGRRIYLNRHLTDADLVVPVGRLGFDPVLGQRGPWGVIFPGLSDAATQRAYRALAGGRPSDPGAPGPALAETAEVSWLLGSQFHVGVVPGATGLARVVAGLEETVRAEGRRVVASSWTFHAESRADLVVAGIGRPGRPARIDALAEGLATAADLVRRGGKIVLLSRAAGPLGPALQRLVGAEAPSPAALHGAEGRPTIQPPGRGPRALAWADVYLLSSLGEDVAEDLSMIPLGRPEEAPPPGRRQRLVPAPEQADLTRAEVADDALVMPRFHAEWLAPCPRKGRRHDTSEPGV